jgi:hypothetical protein
MVIRQPCVQGTCFDNGLYWFGVGRYISTAKWSFLTISLRFVRIRC